MPPKLIFELCHEIKMPQNKVCRPKREIKMPRKKPLKTHLWKKTYKNFFCFVFLKLNKLGMLLQKQDFYFLDERNKQIWQPLITQMGEPWTKLFRNEYKHGQNEEIFHEFIYVHFPKRKPLSPSQDLFKWNFMCKTARKLEVFSAGT